MISFKTTGDFKNAEAFLNKAKSGDFFKNLDMYAQKGVVALSAATPVRTGLTASSWEYSISQSPRSITITWNNTNFNKGVPIALIIQYGHGLPQGGYVAGIDYINPAMKPIFDEIEEYVLSEVNAR